MEDFNIKVEDHASTSEEMVNHTLFLHLKTFKILYRT